MKNYAKVGGSRGKVAYRTPSSFQKKVQAKRPIRAQNLAKRMEHPRPKS